MIRFTDEDRAALLAAAELLEKTAPYFAGRLSGLAGRPEIQDDEAAHVELVERAGCLHPALYDLGDETAPAFGWCALCRAEFADE